MKPDSARGRDELLEELKMLRPIAIVAGHMFVLGLAEDGALRKAVEDYNEWLATKQNGS